jgi:uncharacterized membrane protein YedE/YeeE
MNTEFTPFIGFAGGLLIGLAAVVLLAANGRIAGVSGIAAGIAARASGDRLWRLAFVLGLPLGAGLYVLVHGGWFAVDIEASLPVVVAAGLLVGFGTRLGSGCTSGHGVCGIARLSTRSIVATLVFMAAGVATVWVMRHLVA